MSRFLNLDFVLLNKADFVMMLSLHKVYILSEISTLKTQTQLHIDALTADFGKADVYRSKIITLKNRVFNRNKVRVATLTSKILNSNNPTLIAYQRLLVEVAKQLVDSESSTNEYQSGLNALKDLLLYAANDVYSDIAELQLTILNIDAEVSKLDKLTRLKEMDLASIAGRKAKVQKFMRCINAAIELNDRAIELGIALADMLKYDVDTIMFKVR